MATVALTTKAAPRAPTTRALLACGAVAGPLFTVAWLLEGATRADYDPLRHPVSSLAFSELGWTQRATFGWCWPGARQPDRSNTHSLCDGSRYQSRRR